jgi:hypothetical protein
VIRKAAIEFPKIDISWLIAEVEMDRSRSSVRDEAVSA